VADIGRTSALVWKAHPGYTLIVAIVTVVQGCLPAIQLWISKLLIDRISLAILGEGQDASGHLVPLLTLIGVQAGLFFLAALLDTAQGTARALLGELLRNQISLQLLHKTNRLEVAFFESEQFYDSLQNAYQEASHRPLEIISQLLSLGQNAVTLSSMILLLSWLHWGILPLLIATTLPLLLVQSKYVQQNYWMLRQRAPELRKQHYLGTLLTNDRFIKEIRVFHLEPYFFNLYKSLFAKFFDENRGLIIRRDASSLLASASSVLGQFLAAGYVVVRAVERTITIGDFALYIQAISATQGQLQLVLRSLSMLYSNTLFIRNLFDFLSLPTRDLTAGKEWTEPIKEIEFRNVSFQYPGANRTVLHNISFRIRRGQSLALVGKNGVGKTTLVKLLCRLYEPSSGEILINGKNIADFSPQSVQEQIAVLFQDYGSYYLTAKENVGVGRICNLGDMAAIKAAAQRSKVDALIETLPQKYETVLGRWFDSGVQLSSGEWQKIALARAFMREGTVLILDEPTASLDAEAEFEVFLGTASERCRANHLAHLPSLLYGTDG